MNKINLSRRQLQIREKLAYNFGTLWFENEKFLILDSAPINDKQTQQIRLEIQARIGKDTGQYLIDWIIEDGKLFCFMNIDGVLEKVFASWFNKKIRVLKKLKQFRQSTNNKTLYCREVIDFQFKKGVLIGTRKFTQEFQYVRQGETRFYHTPLMPAIRE